MPADRQPPRNPFRNEADAFRILLMVLAAGAVVVALALLIDPLVGAIVGLVLVCAGALRTWGWIRQWRRFDAERS
jgi:fatty acid desaturase